MVSLKMPERAFRDLSVDQILLSDMDLRTSLNDISLGELGDTMSELGTLQPILVSHDKGQKLYRLIFGGRRLRSAILRGLPTIPSFVMDDLDDGMALVMMLIENLQRENLDPMDEARGLQELRDRFKYDEFETSRRIGRPVRFVEDRLALLRLPKEVQLKLEQHRIGLGQAVCLTRIEGKEKTQIALAHKIEEDSLPVDIVERLVSETTRPKRRHGKIRRRHRVKRTGEPLSEAFQTKQIQQFLLQSEKILKFLEGAALNRWDVAQVKQLCGAAEAFQQGFDKFKLRAQKRAAQAK